MVQKETQADEARKSSLPNLISSEFTAMGQKGMRTELLGALREINRNRLDRMQLEAILASDFTTRLTVARSIPETATACQEWVTKRRRLP